MPEPIPAPRESGFTRLTTEPLYWVRYGPAGASPLLVLHGGPGAQHDYLLPQMLHLAERHDIILYDQRGGGRSRNGSTGSVTWKTHVADLHAVIREFELLPPAMVGYSWGGLLALLYSLEAAERPGLPGPARLALIDPAPLTRGYRNQFEEEFSKRQQGPVIQRMRDELAASGLRESDPAAYRQRSFELSVAGYFSDPEKARNLTPFRVVARIQQSVWESLGDYDVIARLHAVTCPALVVHGRDDPIPAASSIEGAAELGARLVLLDDCGHVPYVEKPEQLFSALDEFLTETDAAGGDTPDV